MSRKSPKKQQAVPAGSSVPKMHRAAAPSAEKRPRLALTPGDPGTKLMVSLSKVDLNGSWCLTRITPEDHKTLLRSISAFESMTVNEVIHSHQRSQDYPLGDLAKPAWERLVELGLDDRDVIHRLRITGERRLFGFVENNRFYALWWDPRHEVVPSRKKHT
ncbi:hypothetical protein ABZ805_08205 [Saccharopolyspora sp. NPDC047091]|uniref:hypothetical protein n=1 Tax=Saccharopolyspora sp. NPDC047091 TaxID=3155924 RepID=UPI0033E85976